MVYGGEPTSVTFPICQLVEYFRLILIYSCLGHVVNLAEVDVMNHITKLAAVETSTAIWEYDPSLPDNRVLNGSLDIIAAIRTIAIKVCFFFKRLQCSLNSIIHRFSHLVNTSKNFKGCKLNVAFMTHSKFHFTAMFGGYCPSHAQCSLQNSPGNLFFSL